MKIKVLTVFLFILAISASANILDDLFLDEDEWWKEGHAAKRERDLRRSGFLFSLDQKKSEIHNYIKINSRISVIASAIPQAEKLCKESMLVTEKDYLTCLKTLTRVRHNVEQLKESIASSELKLGDEYKISEFLKRAESVSKNVDDFYDNFTKFLMKARVEKIRKSLDKVNEEYAPYQCVTDINSDLRKAMRQKSSYRRNLRKSDLFRVDNNISSITLILKRVDSYKNLCIDFYNNEVVQGLVSSLKRLMKSHKRLNRKNIIKKACKTLKSSGDFSDACHKRLDSPSFLFSLSQRISS